MDLNLYGHNRYEYKFEFSRYIEYEKDNKNYRKTLKSVSSEGIFIHDNRKLVLSYTLNQNYSTDLKGFGGVVQNPDVLYDLIQAGLVEKVSD